MNLQLFQQVSLRVSQNILDSSRHLSQPSPNNHSQLFRFKTCADFNPFLFFLKSHKKHFKEKFFFIVMNSSQTFYFLFSTFPLKQLYHNKSSSDEGETQLSLLCYNFSAYHCFIFLTQSSSNPKQIPPFVFFSIERKCNSLLLFSLVSSFLSLSALFTSHISTSHKSSAKITIKLKSFVTQKSWEKVFRCLVRSFEFLTSLKNKLKSNWSFFFWCKFILFWGSLPSPLLFEHPNPSKLLLLSKTAVLQLAERRKLQRESLRGNRRWNIKAENIKVPLANCLEILRIYLTMCGKSKLTWCSLDELKLYISTGWTR